MSSKDLHSISELEFIRFVARAYRSRGFETEIPSDDEYGVHLVVAAQGGLERDQDDFVDEAGCGNRMVVRCEHSAEPVSFNPIAVISAAKSVYSTDWAAVVTNSTFTPPAIHLARRHKVRLISRLRLLRLAELSNLNVPLIHEYFPDGKCDLCFEAPQDWNDSAILRLCYKCKRAVCQLEPTAIILESDSKCARCGCNIEAGEIASAESRNNRTVVYCMESLCSAQRLAFSMVTNP